MRFVLPSLIVVVAALAERLGGGPPQGGLVELAGRGSTALVVLLAWRFGRGRVALAATLLWGAAEAVRAVPQPGLALGLSFVLPLGIATLGAGRELRLAGAGGLARLGALVAGFLAAAFLARPEGTPYHPLLRAPVAGLDRLGRATPPLALLAFAFVGILLATLAWRRRGVVEAALGAALLAALLALERAGGSAFYLATGVVALGVAVVDQAFRLAFEDTLTGLPGRRALEERLAQLGRDYAVAMVDLDHFKLLNDRHGHEVGDQVLRLVARELAAVGGGGVAYRYGGEEFTVVFPGRSSADAAPALEELRRRIAGQRFQVRGPDRPRKGGEAARGRGRSRDKELRVTVSIGLAEKSERHSGPAEVVKAADKALYKSKKAGRDRVTVGR